MDIDPIQNLSPVHFRTSDAEEKTAYDAAYKNLLRYYGHDETRANYFAQLLQDALYKNNTHMLMVWWVGKSSLDL